MTRLTRPVFFALLAWQSVAGLEPVTTGFVAGAAAVLGSLGYKYGWCKFRECCARPWLKFEAGEFDRSFERHVFGQHLVRSVVSRSLRSHFRNLREAGQRHNSKKALTLSFHGWTGSGKNYVAKFVAESMFSEGLKSQYVHLFVPTLHFRDVGAVDIYKLHVQDWIRSNVSACPFNLFIFDEIDKVPDGFLNAVKPFIDTHEVIDGIDFRQSVFLFLSNSGGRSITDKVHSMWMEGKLREEITLGDLELLVQNGAFNEPGGLSRSELVIHHLVDHFIPFLPLEKAHVRGCAEVEVNAALAQMNVSCSGPMHAVWNRVADEMDYWPKDKPLFSVTGCKRVGPKVGLLVEDLHEHLEGGDTHVEWLGVKCTRVKNADDRSSSWWKW